MVALGTSNPAGDDRTSVRLERSGRERLCGASAGSRWTDLLPTEPGKRGSYYRLASIQVIHRTWVFGRLGDQIRRGCRPFKGFVEFFRRTVSDWEIEDMDLAEAQLTRIIEQIGARKLALSLRP